MEISFRSEPFSLTGALRGYAERRLRFALPNSPKLLRVSVLLKDVNGPRGGTDMGCRIRVALHGGGTAIVEEAQPDAYVAIDRACERVARTLYRTLDADRQLRRGARRASFRAAWIRNSAGESA